MRLTTSALLVLAACRADPTPTGSTCPPDNTLTYDNFAAGFMHDYCTRCHAVEVTGADRHGAPNTYNFDTEQGIRFFPAKIDAYAAAGPDATNRLMPNDSAAPTDDERTQLGQWLACLVDGRGDVDAGVPDAGP